MTNPSPPDWEAIRRRYETTSDPVADICADAGIDNKDLRKQARHGWRRANPRPFPGGRRRSASPPVGCHSAHASLSAVAGATAPNARLAPPAAEANDTPTPHASPDTTSPPPPRKRSQSPASIKTPDGRRRLLDRLAAAISLKLEQLERRMTQDLEKPDDSTGASPTATDHERETRAIGALIDNLGKITDMESGYADANGKSPAAATAALGHEADRYRRELAERLQKIIDAAEIKS